MVITSLAQLAVTPEGNPLAEPIPVAPVVACVMSVKAVLIHNVGLDDAVPAVLSGSTVFSMAAVYTTEDGEQVYAPLLYQVV